MKRQGKPPRTRASGQADDERVLPAADKAAGSPAAADARVSEQDARELIELTEARRHGALQELAAHLAHELSQPLTVIVSSVRGAARRLRAQDAGSPGVLDALDRAAVQAKHAGRIVNDLREELAPGGSRETVDVRALVRRVVRLTEPLARQHGVHVVRRLGRSAPGVRGDAAQLKQAVFNLLLAGIQGMQTTPPPQRRLRVEVSRVDGRIEVAVRAGSGPAQAAADAGATLPPRPGAGEDGFDLNLLASRRIVRCHGGDLRVTQAPDGGIMIRITLPAVTGTA